MSSAYDYVPPEPPNLTHLIRGARGGRASIRPHRDVGYRYAYFPEYTGPPPTSTWQKPIVGPPDRPFAELQVAKRLRDQEGWQVAWVHRPGQVITAWEPRSEVHFPRPALALLDRIRKRAGAKAGCWDLFGWKDGQPLFAELKRAGSSERLQRSQLAWMKAAREEGVPAAAFDVVEWYGGALQGRVLRLTSYTYDKPDGWAEWRAGRITYRGGCQSIVEGYRTAEVKTDADLLWLGFAWNHSGVTWCDIRERSVANRKLNHPRRPKRRRATQ